MGNYEIKDLEKSIFNKGYGKKDILPDKDIMKNLLSRRDNWIHQRLDKLDRGISVLDIGCGTGNTSIELAKKGFKVTGIDISDNRISSAKKRAEEMNLPIDFVVGDVEDLNFEDNSFDLIHCAAILHHLASVEDDLMGFKRVLTEKGSIIATEPGLLNPFAFVRRTFFPTSIHTPNEHPFIPFKLVKVFKKYFRKVEYKCFFILNLSAPIVEKMLGKKAGQLTLNVMNPIDDILTKTPLFRNLSWIINVHAFK